MYVINMNFNQTSAELFKQFFSTQAFTELSELCSAYFSRSTAMQKIWLNDWMGIQKQMLESITNASTSDTESLKEIIRKQLNDQLMETAELSENALESYCLWLIKQASAK